MALPNWFYVTWMSWDRIGYEVSWLHAILLNLSFFLLSEKAHFTTLLPVGGSHLRSYVFFRLPVLAGAAGALGATYCSPYIAMDGAYHARSSGQTSSAGTLRLVCCTGFDNCGCCCLVGVLFASIHFIDVCFSSDLDFRLSHFGTLALCRKANKYLLSICSLFRIMLGIHSWCLF